MRSKGADRYLKILAIAAAVCGCAAVVIAVNSGKNKELKKEFRYAALGDSIPNGYLCGECLEEDMKGYPRLLKEELGRTGDMSVNLSQYTKNGITVNGLYEEYLSDEKVRKDLQKADFITVTVGANDLLVQFRKLYRELFKDEENIADIETVFSVIQRETDEDPMLLKEAAELIEGWELDAFERDWERMMECLRQNCKEDACIIVTTLYNPVGEKETPKLLSRVIGRMIGDMNRVIVSCSKKYNCQTADLSDIGVERHLQPDGLHPDSQGQKIIAGRIAEEYGERQ